MSIKTTSNLIVNGLLLLDKPRGITSNAALQCVKRLLLAQKAGHTGSLDPLAEGMLPICLGQATKFSQFLLNADKTYRVSARLGIRTTTGDSEGTVIAERLSAHVTPSLLDQVVAQFRGTLQQTPSMYSALKYKGQPLYKLARQGITVDRASRKIIIYELTLLKHEGDYLELFVRCSKGTYIRTLIEDIGEALGCGATVLTLRRLSVGDFCENQMVTLGHLEKIKTELLSRYVLPLEDMVRQFPVVKLAQSLIADLRHGRPVFFSHSQKGLMRLYDEKNIFVGMVDIGEHDRVVSRGLLCDIMQIHSKDGIHDERSHKESCKHSKDQNIC